MISETTFNNVRDELMLLGVETRSTGKSFAEFSREVDKIQKKYNVPTKEMNLIMDMLANWILENGEEDTEMER